jgi:hypothetical protein
MYVRKRRGTEARMAEVLVDLGEQVARRATCRLGKVSFAIRVTAEAK